MTIFPLFAISSAKDTVSGNCVNENIEIHLNVKNKKNVEKENAYKNKKKNH